MSICQQFATSKLGSSLRYMYVYTLGKYFVKIKLYSKVFVVNAASFEFTAAV
jgi:hypothetical protein